MSYIGERFGEKDQGSHVLTKLTQERRKLWLKLMGQSLMSFF